MLKNIVNVCNANLVYSTLEDNFSTSQNKTNTILFKIFKKIEKKLLYVTIGQET